MQGLKLGATVAALLAMGMPGSAWAESTVLRNVTVIDGTGAAAKPNSAIVMTDGKIAYVGPVSGLNAPAGAKVVDLSGKFVIPGLIDSHVHIGMMKDVTQDEKFETPENVQADLKTYAAYGVTAVQVLGTDKNFVLDMRNQQRKGRQLQRDIVGQFGARETEEKERHQHPDDGQPHELLQAALRSRRRRLAQLFDTIRQRGRKECDPRKES